MPRETLDARRLRAEAVVAKLAGHMPDAHIELDYGTPLELLVAVILSAQCTDRRVNLVTPALFRRYRTAADYARATPAELEPFIQTCGLYRSKAKNIIAAGQLLVARHGGEVPRDRLSLEALPGVGRKTAGVVSNHLGGEPAFPVDTHVGRLARRLGFSKQAEPDKVEMDLTQLLPTPLWAQGHQLLVWHGRRTCFARNPACDRCVVEALCPRRGVKARPVRAPKARSAPTPGVRPPRSRRPRGRP